MITVTTGGAPIGWWEYTQFGLEGLGLKHFRKIRVTRAEDISSEVLKKPAILQPEMHSAYNKKTIVNNKSCDSPTTLQSLIDVT